MARNGKAEAVMAAMTMRWWNSGWYEEGIKQIGRTTALDLRRADSGLFRDLLAAEQLVGFQGSPPSSSRMVCHGEQNIMQEWQEG